MADPKPYLVHLPHYGVRIPSRFRDAYYLSREELEHEALQYADLHTDRLFQPLFELFGGVKNPYSRLLFDPERIFEDSLEPMHTEYRLGWYYENGILEQRPLRDTRYKESLEPFYRRHHRRLNRMARERLERFGYCCVIDCHSFSDEHYWFMQPDTELPDLCIGYEEMHVDPHLVEIVREAFRGYRIGINTPYKGSLVPMDYWKKDRRVRSVMIEINKRIYLQEDNVKIAQGFEEVRGRIAWIANRLMQENG